LARTDGDGTARKIRREKMEETLKKLDEIALELKLLTTEMREKQVRLAEILAALNTTAAQGD